MDITKRATMRDLDVPTDPAATPEPPAPGREAGREYWRTLEELADSEAFQRAVVDEFPNLAVPLAEGVDRRRFLQLMGASMALGGAVACTRQPLERIVPYVRQPEQIVPGRPLYFASAATLGGYATGILVESHMGRPTKIEGNPEHPASLGATDLFAQAEILNLYDPDRSQAITYLGRIRTWSDVVDALTEALQTQEGQGGRGLCILTAPSSSPTLAAQRRRIRERFPASRWYQWDPVSDRAGWGEGAATAATARHDLSRADVIVALDSDLLAQGPGSVRHAKDFGRRRRAFSERDSISRLYVVEPNPTATGSQADHRIAMSPAEIEGFASALAGRLGAGAPAPLPEGSRHGELLEALAEDLRAHAGRSVVAVGPTGSPALHALARGINETLGNAGTTVFYEAPVLAEPTDPLADLVALAAELRAGEVEVLLVLGVNPVYDAPADLGFAEALKSTQAWFRLHQGLREDETAPYCHWHVPAAHFLEAWSDARAFDGTATIQQPLIEPLYGGKSIHEILTIVEGRPGSTGYEIVREEWATRLGEAGWRKALHDGVVPGEEAVRPAAEAGIDVATAQRRIAAAPAEDGLEVLLRPDPTIWDGRFANNGWLQECPKPLTKLTWDNALLLAPRTAKDRRLDTGDVVTVTAAERSLDVPVFVQPGHAEGCATLHLGFGRTRAGKVGDGVGVDAYRMRTTGAWWRVTGAQLRRTGRTHALASTRGHWTMENRDLVREASLEEFRKHPHFAHEGSHEPAADMTLYPPWPYEGYAWGMAINLSACTGCNACLVACVSENNIPVVGKEQVLAQREMHWIRIDQYLAGSFDEPESILNQPVPCQQCENAPCELVCPVAATVHSDEGLNDMVYNRCVGTRYCSNNCPYKVRRFNFFLYQDWDTPSLKLMRNPDVSVRSRGVMEKCTYCVQRISHARIESETEGRRIRDGEIQTACQQACPTEAIVFGDLNDETSEVGRWKAAPTNYGLLAELNTRPRTTYLARVTNTNPKLDAAGRSRRPDASDTGQAHG
jgi:molybdopterin-containing oxidoreductase family iron-sulfur binding subunit